MYDFLDKIGLKTLVEQVKAKFPSSLPANGGNADTLDNRHADDFLLSLNSSKNEYYEIPDGVDVPVWIYQNAKRYTRYITPSGISNRTNLPNNHTASIIRYTFDGMTINAFTENPRKRYITDMVGGSFSSWKEISTTQIDSTTVTVTTDANGNAPLWALSNGLIPISAYSTLNIDIICTPFVAANELWYLAVDSAWTHDKLATASITFTVNYIRK